MEYENNNKGLEPRMDTWEEYREYEFGLEPDGWLRAWFCSFMERAQLKLLKSQDFMMDRSWEGVVKSGELAKMSYVSPKKWAVKTMEAISECAWSHLGIDKRMRLVSTNSLKSLWLD